MIFEAIVEAINIIEDLQQKTLFNKVSAFKQFEVSAQLLAEVGRLEVLTTNPELTEEQKKYVSHRVQALSTMANMISRHDRKSLQELIAEVIQRATPAD